MAKNSRIPTRISSRLLACSCFISVGILVFLSSSRLTTKTPYKTDLETRDTKVENVVINHHKGKDNGVSVNSGEVGFSRNPLEAIQGYIGLAYTQYSTSITRHRQQTEKLERLRGSFGTANNGIASRTHGVFVPRCNHGNGDLLLLIAVHSDPESFAAREAIRLSWGRQKNAINQGSWSRDTRRSWKTVFLLGKSRNHTINDIVTQEAAKYEDLVIGDFLDTYRNLTLKTLLTIRWTAKHCAQAQYILKTDQDCFVNVFELIRILLRMRTAKTPLYVGRIHWDNTATRDKLNKYYVSEAEYNKTVYPPYAAGGGYVFSGSLIPRLLQVARRTAIFPMEDAYFGSLMKSLGVKPRDSTRFLPFVFCEDVPEGDEQCRYERYSVCEIARALVIHGLDGEGQIRTHVNVCTVQFVSTVCEHENNRESKDDDNKITKSQKVATKQ